MDESQKLQAAIYAACLRAALSLNGEIKRLSWLGSNSKPVVQADKAAA